MDRISQSKGMDCLDKMFVLGRPGVAPAKVVPQKCAVQDAPVPRAFRRATPEEHGIDSDFLCRFYQELEENEDVSLHAILILADGEVISEAYARPYASGIWNCAYSFSKTVTGMAIGLLLSDGKITLDDRVTDLLRADVPLVLGPRMRAITVRHLLEMSSGVLFNELGVVTDDYWTRAFMESAVKFEPGHGFSYNSMNSYMLSAIVRAVTGEGLVDYLRPRLFDPLGIRDVLWARCPRGIEQGGMGLYICPEDMAKLAQLMLDSGVWEGKQILPREWVEQMMSRHNTPPPESGNFDYGYQMWVGRENDCFLFNGMFGQNAYGNPAARIAVITTAGNDETFQANEMMRIVEKYFGASCTREKSLPPSPRATKALRAKEATFLSPRAWIAYPTPAPRPRFFARLFRRAQPQVAPLPAICRRLDGESYVFPKNNVGFVPLVIRVIHGNHSKGLTSISFQSEGERFFLTIDEGGAVYRMEVGLGRYAFTDVAVGGEVFRVGVCGEEAVNEDRRRLFKIEFVFCETPNTRRLKIYPTRDGIETRWSETPSKRILAELLRSWNVNMPKGAQFAGRLRSHLDSEALSNKVTEAFEPTLFAISEKTNPSQGGNV